MAKISRLASMELDDEDKLDYPMPIAMADKPNYPYGLRISLTDKEMDRLGIDQSEASVGGTFTFDAKARITHVSSSEDGGGKRFCFEAQIEEMSVDSDD